MAEPKEFVDSFLEQYSSELVDVSLAHDQYYDPQKAHEYYLQTRQLTGRRSASLLGKSKSKKENWAMAKKNIDLAKKAETKTLAAQGKVVPQQLRKTVQGKRAEIQSAMKNLMAELANTGKGINTKVSGNVATATKQLEAQKTLKLQKIADDTKAKMAAVPPLPKGASKEEKAKRQQLINSIKGEAKTQSGKVITETNLGKSNVRNFGAGLKAIGSQNATAKANMAKPSNKQQTAEIAAGLKASVDGARKKLQASRVGLKAKYETIYQSEFDAIKQGASQPSH